MSWIFANDPGKNPAKHHVRFHHRRSVQYNYNSTYHHYISKIEYRAAPRVQSPVTGSEYTNHAFPITYN